MLRQPNENFSFVEICTTTDTHSEGEPFNTGQKFDR